MAPFIFSGSREKVMTTPNVLLEFRPSDVSSIVIKATGAMYIGSAGVSSSNGGSLSVGEPFSISHIDFSPELIRENTLLRIYAVAPVETTAQIIRLGR